MTATVFYLKNALAQCNREVIAASFNKPLADYAPDWQTPHICMLNGQAVLRKDWQTVLNDGDVLAFIDAEAIPQGGGGKSNPLKILLMVAVAYFAPYAGNALVGTGLQAVEAFGGITYGALAGAAIGMVGNALINAIIPPPKAPSSNRTTDAAAPSPTYNIQAQGNSARLESAIPEHFGRLRVFPDFASQPYQEYSGNNQFTFHLLAIGRGEYDLEQIKIEDTPITNFNEIEYEIIPPNGQIKLFPSNVITNSEISGQEVIAGADVGPFVINPPGTVTSRIGIDLIAPKGLFYANDDGGLDAVQIEVQVWGRLVDDNGAAIGGAGFTNLTGGVRYKEWSAWKTVSRSNPSGASGGLSSIGPQPVLIFANELPANTLTNEYVLGTRTFVSTGSFSFGVNSNTQGVYKYIYQTRSRASYSDKLIYRNATGTPQRYSEFFNVANGRWEIFVRRVDAKQTSSRYGHDINWAAARAYQQEPNTYGDVTLIALKMLATNNLSGQSARKINMVATRKLPIWNGTTFSAPTTTRSIAWAFAYVCKQIGLSNAQIDLTTLQQLNATWSARGDYFDGRFDNYISFWEAATQILVVGRAKPFMQGGVMRCMRDEVSTLPVALYSMRNIVQGSFSVDYLMPTEDTADCIDVGYFDKTYWAARRVRASLPGVAPSKPAKIELFGVTERDQAYREGIYQAATNRYRRKVIKFSTEMEGFIPSLGDLIAVQHDMPGWGQESEVEAWNAATKTITLNDPVTFSTGNHYIGLRKRDGSVDGPILVTMGASNYELVLATSPSFTPYTGQAEERTHIAFGASEQWRQPARVISIMPRSLNQVEIQAINEDANVHIAEQGLIAPPFVTSTLPQFTASPVVINVVARPVRGNSQMWLITWDSAAWANDYIVQQSSDGIEWTQSGTTINNNIVVPSLYNANSKFRVAARGNSTGPWMLAANDINPPENVESIIVEGNKISWSRSTALDLDGYKIRFQYGLNNNWDTATPLHEGLINDSPYEMITRPAGTVTFLVKAIDTSKNESILPATTTVNLGDPIVANVISTYNYETDAYAGTVTGGAVNGFGNLVANGANDFYGTQETFFYGNSDTDFYVDTFEPLSWESAYYVPIPLAVGNKMTLTANIIGDAYSIQYRTIGNADFYAVDQLTDFYTAPDDFYYGDLEAAAWQPWLGELIVDQAWYQFRVAMTGGSLQGQINDFIVVIDLPDKNLIINAIALSAGGTRLSAAAGYFNSIKNIQMTLRSGSTATFIEASDYTNPLGPLAQAKNSAGTGVSATIDAHIQGY